MADEQPNTDLSNLPEDTGSQEVTLSKNEIFELNTAEVGQTVDLQLFGTIKDISGDKVVVDTTSLTANVEKPEKQQEETPENPTGNAADILANSLNSLNKNK